MARSFVRFSIYQIGVKPTHAKLCQATQDYNNKQRRENAIKRSYLLFQTRVHIFSLLSVGFALIIILEFILNALTLLNCLFGFFLHQSERLCLCFCLRLLLFSGFLFAPSSESSL